MAQTGRTTQGASTRSLENRCYAIGFTFTAGDALTSVDAWVTVDTSTHNLRAIVYNPADGSRLAQGTETAVNTGASQQLSFPISYTIAGVTTVAVGIISDNQSGGAAAYYDASGPTSYWDSDASTGYPPPATWTGIGTDAGTDDASIAVTYTPAGGGSTARALLLLGAG